MTDLTLPIYRDEEAAREYLEAQRWPTGPYCPHCGEAENVIRLGGAAGRKGQLHCRSSFKKFTVTVGTLYERSHISLSKWLLATHLLTASKKGMSAHQLHRMLGLTYKSSWFMCHRIREAMRELQPTPGEPGGKLGGDNKVVEIDETYIGGKAARPF